MLALRRLCFSYLATLSVDKSESKSHILIPLEGFFPDWLRRFVVFGEKLGEVQTLEVESIGVLGLEEFHKVNGRE